MRSRLVFAAVLTVVVAFADLALARTFLIQRALATRGVETAGEIVETDIPRAGVYFTDGPALMRYRYRVGARNYEGLRTVDRSQVTLMKPGGRVQVVFLPDRPQISALRSEVRYGLAAVVAGAVGNGVALAALLRVALKLRNRRKTRFTRLEAVSR